MNNIPDNAEYLDSILYHSQNIGWPNDEVPNEKDDLLHLLKQNESNEDNVKDGIFGLP